MALTKEEDAATRSEIRAAIKRGAADTITKKSLVAAVIKRLHLEDGHFGKQDRDSIAEIAKDVLASRDTGRSESPLSRNKSSHPATSHAQSEKPAKPEVQKTHVIIDSSQDEANGVDRSGSRTQAGSDSDDSEPEVKAKAKSKKEKTSTSTIPKKRKSDNKQFRTAEFINSEGDPIEPTLNSDDEEAVRPKKKPKASVDKDAEKGEGKAKVKKPRGKKAAEPEDPEEAEIARLKKFVSACGVRKQWATLFTKEDVSTSKAQIKYLKQLLTDLGMPSRMSLSAAAEIKAKRELAQEAADLGIDAPAYKLDAPDGSGRGNTRGRRAAAPKQTVSKRKTRVDSDEEEGENSASEAGRSSDDITAKGKREYVPKDGADTGGSGDDSDSSGSDNGSEDST